MFSGKVTRRGIWLVKVLILAAGIGQLLAQEEHPGIGSGMVDMNTAGLFLVNLATGTSSNPASWPMPMMMEHFGNWNSMFMGIAFLVGHAAIRPARRR